MVFLTESRLNILKLCTIEDGTRGYYRNKKSSIISSSKSTNLYFDGSLVIKTNPLVGVVGKGHLLLVVPDQCGVILVKEVANLRRDNVEKY